MSLGAIIASVALFAMGWLTCRAWQSQAQAESRNHELEAELKRVNGRRCRELAPEGRR